MLDFAVAFFSPKFVMQLVEFLCFTYFFSRKILELAKLQLSKIVLLFRVFLAVLKFDACESKKVLAECTL